MYRWHRSVSEPCTENITGDTGEVLRLLRELGPDEDKFYAEGAEEVEEEIEKS